jgi:hypothetical protein
MEGEQDHAPCYGPPLLIKKTEMNIVICGEMTTEKQKVLTDLAGCHLESAVNVGSALSIGVLIYLLVFNDGKRGSPEIPKSISIR